MNFSKLWSKTRVWLALLLVGLIAWPLITLVWNYKASGNDAAKAHWRPATVSIQKIVGGPTLHNAAGGGGESIYVYNIKVQSGPLTRQTIKNVSLAHSYGVGSTIPLWLDSYGDVSDTNAQPESRFWLVWGTFCAGTLIVIGLCLIIRGFYEILKRRRWLPVT